MAYSTISKPSLHFNTKLYTGNGGTNAQTGVGFQPDWLWLKKRNSSANHFLFDAVRGASKELNSNNTEAEASPANYLSSFDSDGFTIGSDSDINGNSDTFTSWSWKANGAGSANTDGSATSTVSVNTTAGFSIVKYTNQNVKTIGHGLGVVPKVLIGKCTSGGSGWVFASADLLGSWDKFLLLNSTSAFQTESRFFYPSSAAPTSSVFSSDQSAWSAGGSATENMICYAFAEKKGFSKFGKYVGNGNADGAFVYCGFKPAFVMIKRASSGTERWVMMDIKRDTFNVSNKAVYADDNQAEVSSASEQNLDILSNGFKIRNSNTKMNTSDITYVFMAFAEEPLVANVSNSIPATAR